MKRYGLDTEDDGNGRVHLGCIVSEDGDVGVYRSAQALREALSILGQEPCEVWTTNLAYELVNIYWPDLDDTFPTFNRMGKVILAQLRFTKLTFRDTLAFIPASVKKLGDMVGLPKLEADFHSAEYCARDAEISLRAGCLIQDGFASIGVERLGGTSGGTAYRAWRQANSGYKRIPDEWCEVAYYGGRVECYRMGRIDGPIHRWDVRSMYPSAMVAGPMPLPGSDRDGYIEGRLAAVECSVNVPQDSNVAPLPVRRQGRLYFPRGTFRGAWMSPELEAAVNAGARIMKIHDARTWERTCFPFDAFIREGFEFRKRGPAEKLAGKILVNSLYGKFGQGRTRLTVQKVPAPFPYAWGRLYRWGMMEFRSYGECTRYPWAALITARARTRLFSLLRAAGDSLLYCDTDSVFTVGPCAALAGQEGTELGMLEALDTCEEIDILAPKVYRLRLNGQWDYKAKGFGILTAEEMENLWATRVQSRRRPTSLRQAMARDERPGIWYTEEKHLAGGPGNRLLSPGSNQTHPLTLRG